MKIVITPTNPEVGFPILEEALLSKANVSVRKNTLAQSWRRLASWPGGKQLFSFIVGRTARYTGTIGGQIVELERGRSVVQMADRRIVRNHLKSIHAIALMNLGELVTGLTVLYQVDGRGRGIVTGLRMEYFKKARGTITGTCTFEVPDEEGEHEFEVTGILTDADGDAVAQVWANWKLQIATARPSNEVAAK